jgi:signal transduction histidine kinase
VDLARQVERAQQAVRARDDLVAVVSHDLRNPLGVVQMQSSLLLRGLGPQDEDSSRRLRASAERIQRAVDRMNALLSDLLDLAKIEAGRFEVHPTRQASSVILDEALVVMSPLAEQKSIRLVIDASPSADVLADRDRIYQVLSNLLSNAIKFTPEGGEIRLCTQSAAEGVRFSVIDAGPGIPARELPHIFNRYWQARKTARQGSGLGLYIAKGIVEAHHGRIWVESSTGVGSSFHFVLPATG